MAKTTWKGVIVTQLIAVVVFVGVPVLVTLMAPFTDLTARRSGDTATVTITRYMLVFIPWQTRQIERVTDLKAEISPEFRYADTSENRRKGRAGAVNHATGQLKIIGDGPEVVVQATPELAEATQERFRIFLASHNASPLDIPLYASWWLSYVLGGIATGFAALYIGGAAMAIVTFPFRKRSQPAAVSG